MYTHKYDCKKAVGSEIFSIFAMILTMALIALVVVFFGQYNAEIRAQVLADIIVDGTTSYAKNDMNISKLAAEKMSKKIYSANAGSHNGVELTGMSMTEPTLIGVENADLLSSTEREFVKRRGIIKEGALKSLKYNTRMEPIFNVHNEIGDNGYDPASDPELATVYEGMDELYAPTQEYEYIPYKGPAYMDEFITVEITAKCTIPLISRLTTKTKSATAISIARVPYNGRTVNDTVRGFFESVENRAYQEIDLETDTNDPNVIRHGSLRQKMFLTARRAMGDKYHTQTIHKYVHWPSAVKWTPVDMATSYSGEDAINKLKTCYWFVSSCFIFDGMTSLADALSTYPSTCLIRNIEYKRNVSPEELWEAMHPEEISITSGRESTYNPDTGMFWHKYDDAPNRLEFIGKNLQVIDYSVSGTQSYWKLTSHPPVSLAQLIAKYGNVDWDPGQGNGLGSTSATEKGAIWQVVKAERCPELQVGDILVWEDPNWYPYIMPELRALAAMKEKDMAVLDSFKQVTGGAICHYAIYYGDNYLLHMAGQGVIISTFDDQIINPEPGWEGPVIAQIIRFTDKGSEGTQLSDSIKDIEFNEGV